MAETEPNGGSDENADAPDDRTPLRRRENRPVEFERRRRPSNFDIGALLEMHLDQCKTRRAMIHLLEEWLTEATGRDDASQDADYTEAVRRAIEVMRAAPDVETAIVTLQRRY